MPLSAWSYTNFHKISSVFGRVVSIDYSKFMDAKISLITDCLFKINCKMWFSLESKKYPIFITKTEYPTQPIKQPEKHQQCQKQQVKPIQSSLSSEDDDEDAPHFWNTNSPILPHLNQQPTSPQSTSQTSLSKKEAINDCLGFPNSPHPETLINPLFEKCGILFSYPTKKPTSPKENQNLSHSSSPNHQLSNSPHKFILISR